MPEIRPVELQAIDPIRQALRNAVRAIIQKDVAAEVWYQDRGCEEKLVKCLENLETTLVDYISNIFATQKEELLEGVRNAVDEVEILEIHHEKWCDALPEGLRCNCSQSDLFWLQKSVIGVKDLLKKQDK